MELNKDLYIDGVSDYLEQQENLYNSSTDTLNYIINSEGELVSASTWRVTDYIPVVPGSTFYYEGLINTGASPMSAFYNSSKQFISSFKQAQGINNIVVPSGASYIRFSLNNSDINLFKFDNRSYYGKYLNKGDGILIPYTLYENSSGSTGNITLSDDVSNYKFLEIYFGGGASANDRMDFVKVDLSLSKNVSLFKFSSDAGGTLYAQCRDVTISGTTISTLDSTRYWTATYTGSSWSKSANNSIYIKKVIGYK